MLRWLTAPDGTHVTRRIAAGGVPGLFRPGMSVFVQGGASEPVALVEALRRAAKGRR